MPIRAAEPRLTAIRPGRVLDGKYELRRILGTGGMGSVWLARNLVLEVDVAIKLIRAEMASTDAVQRLLVNRLLQEARAAAQIEHPSIVSIHDYGETEEGAPFLVMEFIEGESLAEILAARGRLSATSAVQMLLPVAGALAAAHERGIIHRDLKPGNIMLAKTGGGLIPKIVDFGIAKVLPRPRSFTGDGEIVGSPGYLSPQQARGLPVDGRADVWSFAVVLYELITGILPFDGPNITKQLVSIVENEPEPTDALGAGDAELWAILSRGLAKDSAERWPSITTFARALAEWAVARGVDVDIAGHSIRDHWLEAPAAVECIESMTPRPTSRSVPASSRPEGGKSWVWLAVAAIVTVAVIGVGVAPIRLEDPSPLDASPVVGAQSLAIMTAATPVTETAYAAEATVAPPTPLVASAAVATARTTSRARLRSPVSPQAPAKAAPTPAPTPVPTAYLPIPATPGF